MFKLAWDCDLLGLSCSSGNFESIHIPNLPKMLPELSITNDPLNLIRSEVQPAASIGA
jgi:hypothetical protein